MPGRRNRLLLWGAILAGVLVGACTNTPDLVREEKIPGEAISPADQFRAMQSGKFFNGDYFLDRGQVQNGFELFGPDRDQEKKSAALQDRVARLEQQVQSKPNEEAHQAPTPVSQAAPASAPNPSSAATPPIPNDKKPNPGPESSKPVANAAAAETVDSVRTKTRLQLLKDLRDQHLITDEQYRVKVKEILDKL